MPENMRAKHFRMARKHAAKARKALARNDRIGYRVHSGIARAHVDKGYSYPASKNAEGWS
jgi:hypothetical protein